MTVTIKPSTARGTLKAPPSKSMAHRLLLCAALAKGTSTISNIAYSDDILATLDCIRALGAECKLCGDTVTVTGTDITKLSGKITLPCRESASTLRFLIPVCAKSSAVCRFTGSERLFSRPLSVYEEIFASCGISYKKGKDYLEISGKLPCGEYNIRGDVSSQFASGMITAAVLSGEKTAIRVAPPFESKSYVYMTLSALSKFGVSVQNDDENTFIVENQILYPAALSTEGDYSNAAFAEALSLLGGEVTVTGLDESSADGNKVYREHFKAIESGFARIDLSDCPDLAPILISLAAYFHGAHFTGTRRLRFKESDRAEAMAQELAKLGAKVSVGENEITVQSSKLCTQSEALCGHNDHRIVMALAVLLTKFGGSIDGAEAVKKSYPQFFEELRALGIEISTGDDGE